MLPPKTFPSNRTSYRIHITAALFLLALHINNGASLAIPFNMAVYPSTRGAHKKSLPFMCVEIGGVYISTNR